MPSLTLHFSLHHPARLRTDYHFFQIGKDHRYENEIRGREVTEHLARHCYLPNSQVLYDLCRRHQGRFRFSLSVSGVLLEQLERYAPEVIVSLKNLVNTGCVELIGETFHHSLAALFSRKEFEAQIQLHQKKILEIFGKTPVIFRNTGLLFRNDLAETLSKMGFAGVLAEGQGPHLGFHSPRKIYQAKAAAPLKLILRDDRLSEDLSRRFGDMGWNEYPLTAAKYVSWIHAGARDDDTVNLFLDYAVFGIIHPKESGIYDFLWHFPGALLAKEGFAFLTPSELLAISGKSADLDLPEWTSEGTGRDLSEWKSNPLQESALEYLYSVEKAVLRTKDPEKIGLWRRLQSHDFFRAMHPSGNAAALGFPTAYDAYVVYINILNDFKEQL